MRLFSVCVALSMLGLAACSDDGVPAASTGTEGDSADSLSTTAMTSTSPTTSPTGTTDEGTTEPGSSTDHGSDSTFGPESSGDSGSSSGTTAPDTESTSSGSTTDTSSSSGSGTGTGPDTDVTTSDTGDPTTGGPDPGELGGDCEVDMDCDSGVCWNFEDYDPFCFGAACSIECASNEECQAAFEEAGAPYPENVSCGPDGRCGPMGSGWGLWACA